MDILPWPQHHFILILWSKSAKFLFSHYLTVPLPKKPHIITESSSFLHHQYKINSSQNTIHFSLIMSFKSYNVYIFISHPKSAQIEYVVVLPSNYNSIFKISTYHHQNRLVELRTNSHHQDSKIYQILIMISLWIFYRDHSIISS